MKYRGMFDVREMSAITRPSGSATPIISPIRPHAPAPGVKEIRWRLRVSQAAPMSATIEPASEPATAPATEAPAQSANARAASDTTPFTIVSAAGTSRRSSFCQAP